FQNAGARGSPQFPHFVAEAPQVARTKLDLGFSDESPAPLLAADHTSLCQGMERLADGRFADSEFRSQAVFGRKLVVLLPVPLLNPFQENGFELVVEGDGRILVKLRGCTRGWIHYEDLILCDVIMNGKTCSRQERKVAAGMAELIHRNRPIKHYIETRS